MPTSYIKKLHASGHGSIETLEKKWEEAKSQAAKEGQGGNFAYITGIFKRMAGIKESFSDFYEGAVTGPQRDAVWLVLKYMDRSIVALEDLADEYKYGDDEVHSYSTTKTVEELKNLRRAFAAQLDSK